MVRASPEFKNCDKAFWSNIKSLSQKIGYTIRRQDRFTVPTLEQLILAYDSLGLNRQIIETENGHPTALAELIIKYFTYRADTLEKYVQPRLMNADQAEELFNELRRKYNVSTNITMNKQKGEKAKPAYLTEITNMLIAEHIDGIEFDRDPRELTSFVKDGRLIRTLSRRVDGAFPSAVNPIAIWEIKEYYHTTTFGSRVADGVYETLLDGLELEDLRKTEHITVQHLLIVDAHYTWWTQGKSYLCRMIDMLNMGYVQEIMFGREVVERLPEIASNLVVEYRNR